jgi:hypothetical protein
MDLAEAPAAAIEQVVSDPKAPIVRPDVRDVEAETGVVTKAVRMEDDVEVGREAVEPVDDLPRRSVRGRQRSVQRDALEAVELAASASEELDERLRSIPPDGGQHDETPPFAVGPGDCGSPVVALQLVRAGGDSDISRQSHRRRLYSASVATG